MKSVPSVRNENTSCGLPKADAFHLFLDPVDSDYPWPAIVVMSTLGAAWYWCCDQVNTEKLKKKPKPDKLSFGVNTSRNILY